MATTYTLRAPAFPAYPYRYTAPVRYGLRGTHCDTVGPARARARERPRRRRTNCAGRPARSSIGPAALAPARSSHITAIGSFSDITSHTGHTRSTPHSFRRTTSLFRLLFRNEPHIYFPGGPRPFSTPNPACPSPYHVVARAVGAHGEANWTGFDILCFDILKRTPSIAISLIGTVTVSSSEPTYTQ